MSSKNLPVRQPGLGQLLGTATISIAAQQSKSLPCIARMALLARLVKRAAQLSSAWVVAWAQQPPPRRRRRISSAYVRCIMERLSSIETSEECSGDVGLARSLRLGCTEPSWPQGTWQGRWSGTSNLVRRSELVRMAACTVVQGRKTVGKVLETHESVVQAPGFPPGPLPAG